MALRFNLPFTSLNRNTDLAGSEWEVELWDDEFVGSVTEITGEPRGCVIEWEGDNDTIKGVMASSATYSILIEEEADMAIITALAGAKRGRFKMVIRRAGASTVEWAGIVHTDQVSYPDAYFPFLLDIFATDGISDLKDVDYVSAPDTPYTGTGTIMEHLVNIVGKIGLDDVGTWGTDIYRSTANWYSEDMSTSESPLTQAEILHDRFLGKDRDGENKYWSTYAVLDALMTFMHCQFFMAGGMYHIRQLESYHDNTQKEHYFDNTGTLTSTVAAADLDRVVDYTTGTDMVKQNGGRYTFLPPIKEVCIDYHHLTNHNRATGQAWNNSNQTWHTLPGVVLVDAADTTYIKGSIKIRHRSQIGITTPPAIWPSHRFRFLISLRFNVAGNYYYLKRDYTTGTVFYDLQPEQLDWELGATDQMIVYGPAVVEADNNVEKQFLFSFTTPDLPTSFDGLNIEMRIQLDGVEKTDGTDLVLSSPPYNGNLTDWNTLDVFIGVEEEGIGSNPDNETWRTCTETTGDNTEKRYIDTYFGDGPAPFSLSAIRVAGVATETWQIGGTGSALPLADMLGQQVLRFRKTPQSVYQGTFIHPDIRVWERFVNDDKGYMATRIAVDCFNNLWSGDFVLMDGTVSGITTGTPYIPPGPPRNPGLPPTYPGPPKDIPTGPQTPAPEFPPFDGILGGTVPGYVTIAEQSPTRLRTDLVADTFNTTHSLPVNAVGFSWVKKGDQISVINPITHYRETFTVATTPLPSATSIAIDTGETMVKDFPYGSFVKLTKKTESQVKGWSYLEEDVTGEYWEIPGSAGILPTVANYDAATLRERVKVVKSGLVFLYSATSKEWGFHIENTDPQRIRFWGFAAGDTCYLEVR